MEPLGQGSPVTMNIGDLNAESLEPQAADPYPKP